MFGPSDGVAGQVRQIFVDSKGRLWIGTAQGLLRVDEPSRERPAFVRYDTSSGLSSGDVAAVTEDAFGRLWAATGRGIDRFEPDDTGPGRVRHYTTADGIAAGELQLAFRDRRGALWFSTPLGVSRLVPALDRPRAPPPVFVTGLSVGGVAQPVSDLGEAAVAGIELRRTPLRMDFVGLGFSPGEALRYQYRLEGADPDWSAPTDQRSVVYASLSPGHYRFLVRAVASEGAVSPEPARVAFTVLPPLWRRGWFLASAGVAALAVVAWHRARLARLLAVADLRTRIATDLHDDIGASLSQIAILSEVARRGADGPAPRNAATLSDIAGISRGLVDSMSDIVWAINPEHDQLSDLAHRMRRFATDLLGGQAIALGFRCDRGRRPGRRRERAPAGVPDVQGGDPQRRAARGRAPRGRRPLRLEGTPRPLRDGRRARLRHARAVGGQRAREHAPPGARRRGDPGGGLVRGRGTRVTLVVRREAPTLLSALRGKTGAA